jgi:phage-related minor tail protein
MKLKADSVFDLAQNTKAFAESKRMEYDAFIEGLDKDVLNKIKSIAQKDIVAKNKSNGNSGNNGLNSSDEQAANAIQYSESYINKLNALEKEFDRLEAVISGQIRRENELRREIVPLTTKQNTLLTEVNALKAQRTAIK